MKKKFLFISVLITPFLHAIPLQITRLIIVDAQGKPFKTVDLVADRHSIGRSYLRDNSSMPHFLNSLSKEIRDVLAKNDVMFLKTLQEMDAQNTETTLLWEFPDKNIFNNKYQDEQQILLNKLQQGLLILFPEIKTLFKNKLKCIDVDKWRGPFMSFAFNETVNCSEYEGDILDYWHSIRMHFMDNSPVQDLLKNIEHLPKDISKKLTSYYKKFKEETLFPIYEESIKPCEEEYESLCGVHAFKVIDFLNKQNLLTSIKKELFDNNVMASFTDCELLLNIFNAATDHVIVYAGIAHTEFLKKKLIGDFNAKHIVSVGMGLDALIIENNPPSFTANAWEILKEKPQESLDKYYKNGIENRMVGSNLLQIFSDLEYLKGKEFDIKLTEIIKQLDDGMIDSNSLITLRNKTLQSLMHKRLLQDIVSFNIQKLK